MSYELVIKTDLYNKMMFSELRNFQLLLQAVPIVAID